MICANNQKLEQIVEILIKKFWRILKFGLRLWNSNSRLSRMIGFLWCME